MIYGRGKVSVLITSTYVTSTFSKYLVILHTYTTRLYMDSHVSAAKRELTRFPELPGEGRAKLFRGLSGFASAVPRKHIVRAERKIMGFDKRSQLILNGQTSFCPSPAT